MDKYLVNKSIGKEVIVNAPTKELTNCRGIKLLKSEIIKLESKVLTIDDVCDCDGDVCIRTKENDLFYLHHRFLELKEQLKGIIMEELKIKDEYIGWSFEPNLKKVKSIFINGHEIDFKLIIVKENCNDGKSSFDGIFQDAVLYIPTTCGLELEIKLTDFIKQSRVFYR